MRFRSSARLLVLALTASPGLAQEPAALPLFDDQPGAAETLDWPSPPTVRLEWDSRGPGGSSEWKVGPPDWKVLEDRRHARVTKRVDDVAFIVWFEQFEGIDATRVTVAAINGFADAGPRYFERYTIRMEDRAPQTIAGQHVILSRGALIRRFTHGPQESVLREWRYVHENKPVPEWAVTSARKDTAARTAFPFRDQDGRPVNLGPYNFFWKNRSLEDSHGGQGIGPFHGGPDDWLKCAAGRANREAEMLLAFQRPIWMLADDFSPLTLQIPYWMGRTRAHEPEVFRYEPDDWCAYAKTLFRYRFADFTHLSRGTSGAAALAKWDIFAVACLGAVLNDFKTSESMTRNVGTDANGNPIRHPGAKQDNALLWPLWLKIDVFRGPSSVGNRGLAHWLRLLRWCRPYFPKEELEPFEEGLRQLVRNIADDYGITMGGDEPEFPGVQGGVLSKPLVAPYAYTFQQQLVTYECQRFGGLSDIGEKAARFLGPLPPKFFEVRPGRPGDRVMGRNNSADKDQTNKIWAYAAYGNMTHDVMNGYSSASAFLKGMSQSSINGSSQDLDNTPRHLWESGL